MKTDNNIEKIKAKIQNREELLSSEVHSIFVHYVKQARDFFCLDPAWNITVKDDKDETQASVTFFPRYLEACINYCLPYYRDNPHEIKETAGHEVAHIFLSRIHLFMGMLPDEYSDESHPFLIYYKDACEEATTRLSRLFNKNTD